MRMFRTCGRAVLLAGLLSDAVAQPEQLSESAYLDDFPVVVSASRLPQNMEDAPGAITVIDRDMIRASGVRSVPDIFRLVPGMVVGYPSGPYPVVGYHGMSGMFSTRMRVLLDGRDINTPFQFGAVDWSKINVNLEDIERIEVVRGSNSAAWGTSAQLGVANIITRNPSGQASYVRFQQGADGIRDSAAGLNFETGPGHVRITVGAQHDDGLRAIRPDEAHRQVFSVLGQWALSGREDLTLQMGGSHAEQDIVDATGDASNPYRMANLAYHYFQGKWRKTFDNGDDLSVGMYHSRESGRDSYKVVLPPTVTVDYGRKAIRDQLDVQHHMTLSPELRMVWGGELKRDEVTFPLLLGTNQAVVSNSASLFSSAEWYVTKNWVLDGGLFVARENINGTHASPRLGLNWHFAPGHTLKVGGAVSYRTPSLMESKVDWKYVVSGVALPLRIQFVPNGSLQPEKVTSAEIDYLGNFREQGLTLDARLYREQISNLIVARRVTVAAVLSTQAFQLQNSDSANLTGFEYQLRWHPMENLKIVFGQNFSHSNSSLIDFAASVPKNVTHLMMDWDAGPWSASTLITHTGRMSWYGEYSDFVPAQWRTDVRLARKFRMGSNTLEVFGVVQNLNGNRAEFRTAANQASYSTRKVWLGTSLDF